MRLKKRCGPYAGEPQRKTPDGKRKRNRPKKKVKNETSPVRFQSQLENSTRGQKATAAKTQEKVPGKR